jgi:condensin complex subunit 1
VIPLKFISSVTESGAGRLEDRTAQVRKYAIQLLTSLLVHNPFSPSLKLSEFCSQLSVIETQIKEHLATKVKPRNEGGEEEDEEEAQENQQDEVRSYNLPFFFISRFMVYLKSLEMNNIRFI